MPKGILNNLLSGLANVGHIIVTRQPVPESLGMRSGCSNFSKGCECAQCRICREKNSHLSQETLENYWNACNQQRLRKHGQPKRGYTPVYICVYSGAHWGVAIFNEEFSFGGGNIYHHSPKKHGKKIFWYKMCVGVTECSIQQIKEIINNWRHSKQSNFTDQADNENISKYTMLENNCRAFSLALISEIVSVRFEIPNKWSYKVI